MSRILGELAPLRGDELGAAQHFGAAIAECRETGVVPLLALSEEARARRRDRTTPAPPPAMRPRKFDLAIAREVDVWLVSAKSGAPFRMKHAKAMEYLDYLLRNPSREVYVLALAAAGVGPEDAGAILDDRAKQAYRRRVEELDPSARRGGRARR